MDLGTPLKNFQHERFAMAIVKGLNHTQAAIYAGYKETRAVYTGRDLAINSHIIDRIKQLNELTHTPGIMSVKERKIKLSDMARPCLSDFLTVDKEGLHIELDKDTPGRAAISEVTIRTESNEKGAKEATITKIKLHDPVRAIAEHNRMEGEHAPAEMRHTGVDGGPVILKVVYDGDEKKGKEPENEDEKDALAGD